MTKLTECSCPPSSPQKTRTRSRWSSIFMQTERCLSVCNGFHWTGNSQVSPIALLDAWETTGRVDEMAIAEMLVNEHLNQRQRSSLHRSDRGHGAFPSGLP